MSETLQAIIAGLIVLAVGIPASAILTKWEEEMEEKLKKNHDNKKVNEDE